MDDRLAIASEISAGIFAGVPYGLDDFEQTQELKDAEKKTVKAISRLSLMMADALIEEAGNGMGDKNNSGRPNVQPVYSVPGQVDMPALLQDVPGEIRISAEQPLLGPRESVGPAR